MSGLAVGRRLVSRHSNRHIIDDLRLHSLYSLIVFRQQHWKSRLVALIFAIAWIVLGLSFVVNPLNGMSSLAILFGFLFVLGGISRIVNGCQTRQNKAALAGIFLSACWIYLSLACGWMNPQQSWLFITAFIGVEMIFSAIGLLVLRNKMKHAEA